MSRVRLVMPSPAVSPAVGRPGLAGLDLVGFNPSALVSPIAGTTLFQEPFEDTNFASRGWYDMGAGLFVLDSVNPHSGSSCVRFTWQAGNSSPDGPNGRFKFTATDEVYIEYWIRYSSNYVGSGRVFGPHEYQIFTDEDIDFVPPADTHLSIQIELLYESGLGLKIRSGATDNADIDQANIGVDLTGITEARGAHGCNGFLEFSHTSTNCFDRGDQFVSERYWNSASGIISAAEKVNWHKIGAYFKLNTITGGTADLNGIIQWWIDNVLVVDHTSVVLRTGLYPNMKFNQVIIAPYISVGSPVVQSIWYDDLLIATSKPGAVLSPVVIPGSASTIISSFPVIPIVTGSPISTPGNATLVITGFAPTITLGVASPEIQRALFIAPNVWDIQGTIGINSVGFQNAVGSTPTAPHSALAGEYSIDIPLGNWIVPNRYNFPDLLSFGVIELDFEIRADSAPTGQIEAIRFQDSPGLSPGASTAVGGLHFKTVLGSSIIAGVFEGFGAIELLVSFEAAWDSTPLGSNIQINNLADGAWHKIRFWYDVASPNRRMKLEIDNQALTRPNGTSVYILNASENCGGQFGVNAATWQNGWIERCAVDGGFQIGGGSWIESGFIVLVP